MRVDLVVDASVVAKFFFEEEGSERAQSLLTSGAVLAAPDLLWLEMASLAATRVRRGLSKLAAARDAVVSLGDMIDEVVASRVLATDAFRHACDDVISAYDGAYLALAQRLSAPLVTADVRLAQRAQASGLAQLVRML